MSEFYGPTEDAASAGVIHRALELGVTLLDTADMYGQGHNERLIGRAVRGREGAFVATKCGIRRRGQRRWHDNHPDYIREACEQSLRRLGVEAIDLFYLHRRDPQVPLAESIGAMAKLVECGKVRALGLSEVSSTTLRAAYQIHPITAVQTVCSLWSREVEDEVLPAARAIGATLIAYSPLGRGFLAGTINSVESLDADDFRRANPRFQRENLKRNLALLTAVRSLAAEREVTPAQLRWPGCCTRAPTSYPSRGPSNFPTSKTTPPPPR